jgi:twinkle protein
MDWLEAAGIPHDHLPGGALTRKGNIKARCPRCGRKNALSIHMTKRVWNCHYSACGWTGADYKAKQDPFLFEKIKQVPKPMPPEEMEVGDAPFEKWRGISMVTLAEYGVSFGVHDDQPIFEYTFRNQVTNTKRRWVDAEGKKGFNVTGGSILIPFGYDQAVAKLDELGDDDKMQLVLTEGEIDALSCIEAGWTAISMPNGANQNFDWSNNAEPLLRSPKVEIIIAVDNDTSGIAIEKTLAGMFGKHRCYRVGYPEGCKDANETLEQHGVAMLNSCLMAAEQYPVEGIIAPKSIYRDLERLYQGFGTERLRSTGWVHLDALWTFAEAQTTLIYGVPGSGKSEFVDNLIVNLCRKHNMHASVFSPEYFPPERYMAKWVEKYSGGNFFYGDGRISELELPEYARWVDNHLSILMPDEFTVDALLELAEVEVYRNRTSILLLDNWSAMVQDNDRITETKWIGQELTKLQTWGRNHNCHVIIVNHPTKMFKRDDGNYVKPKPYDMAGSAQWYNKADSIICVWRDMVEGRNPVEIEVQKIRYKEVGIEGTAYFDFNRYSSTYRDIGSISRNGDKAGASPTIYKSMPMGM